MWPCNGGGGIRIELDTMPSELRAGTTVSKETPVDAGRSNFTTQEKEKEDSSLLRDKLKKPQR